MTETDEAVRTLKERLWEFPQQETATVKKSVLRAVLDELEDRVCAKCSGELLANDLVTTTMLNKYIKRAEQAEAALAMLTEQNNLCRQAVTDCEAALAQAREEIERLNKRCVWLETTWSETCRQVEEARDEYEVEKVQAEAALAQAREEIERLRGEKDGE